MHHAWFISGWAHPASSLQHLANLLGDKVQAELLTWSDVVDTAARAPSIPPIVIGWSLGGMLALEMAASQCAAVRALVLISTTARFCRTEGYECGMPEAALESLRVALRDNAVNALRSFANQAALPRKRLYDLHPQGDLANLEQGLDLLRTKDLRESAASLCCPTLVLHGAEDRVIPVDAGRRLASSRPQGQFQVFDRVGHDLPVRVVDDVAATIRRFLP